MVLPLPINTAVKMLSSLSTFLELDVGVVCGRGFNRNFSMPMLKTEEWTKPRRLILMR
jgi:hypothetical protein